LELTKLRRFDVEIREFAEARVYAIDSPAFGNDALDNLARLLSPVAGGSRERNRFIVASDRSNLREGKSLTVNFEHGSSKK
jgi:hypothetical protein